MNADAGAREPVQGEVDADGVGWIAFDAPDARANVFDERTLVALARVLDEMESGAAAGRVKAVVLVSEKERIFIAGADLKWLAGLRDPAEARVLSRRGQALFQRIADARVPVVCAIHGACAGGGFELALACHGRVASDAPATQIGLPETSIGTIPGWGGCVRLPRLIGVKPALEHILQGKLVAARAARENGLVDEVVAPGELRVRAKTAALALARRGIGDGCEARTRREPVAPEVAEEMRAQAKAGGGRRNPARGAAVEAVVRAAELPVAEALAVEAEFFAEVTSGEACRNLVRVFLLKEAARKRGVEAWFGGVGAGEGGVTDKGNAGGPPALRVGVVGAGVMGSGIAQCLAASGFEVVLREVKAEALERGMEVVRRQFEDAVKRGRMTAEAARAAQRRITTTMAWGGFERCEVVIEAIVENAATKRALFTELANVVQPDAVLASNTSALPIEEIAGHVPGAARTIGIHFFNPVSRMPLVELVLARETSRETAERALALVRALGKSPVICRSSPGFLVTRVLFFYLNAAVRRWEAGVSAAAIDGAMREFGWPMGPLRLIDEVGVDVTDFIFAELAHYFPERFAKTETCGRMAAAGLRGRKNGAGRGFYRHDGKNEVSNEEECRPLAHAHGHVMPEPDEAAGVADGLMAVMVEEARRCVAEGVVKSEDDVDFALLSGAGFPAWRGGLLHWARLARGDKRV